MKLPRTFNGWMALICCLSTAAPAAGPSVQDPPPRDETIRKLADPRIEVRIEAAERLYCCEPADAALLGPLINAVRVDQGLGAEKLHQLIEQLAETLSRIGESALPMLSRTLRNHDPRVQLLSAQALFQLAFEEEASVPLPVLIESTRVHLALKDHAEKDIFRIAWNIGRGLAKLDTLPLAPFLRILEDDPDWRMRLIAIYTVLEMGITDEAVLPLVQALGDRFRLDPPLTDRDLDEPVAYPVRELSLLLLKEEGYNLQSLGSFAQAQKVLIENLESEDQDLRRRSIELLGEFNVSAAAAPLVGALRDADPQIRSSAADALQCLEDPKAVEPFIPLLSDSDAHLRRLATEILLTLEGEAVAGLLIARLKDEDAQVRREALPVLDRFDGARALLLLAPLLQDPDAEVRSAAVRQLGNLHQEEGALKRLLAAVDDPQPSVRRSALIGLKKSGRRTALSRVINALSDPEAQVRRYAVWALGNWPGWKEARALDGVIQALTDTDPSVREAAFEVVKRFRPRRAARQLAQCFKLSDAEMRYEISTLLVEIGGPLEWRILSEMVITQHEGAPDAIRILGRVRYREALFDLREALEDERPEVRSASAEALGRMLDRHSIAALAALLKDPDSGVRVSAAKAVGIFESPVMSDSLLEALADPNRLVRWAAAESLGKLQEERAIPRIAALIGELEKSYEKEEAVALLGFFPHPESVRELIKSLGDGNLSVRRRACKTLAEMVRPQLIGALAPLLSNPEATDDPVAARALKTLQVFGYQKEIDKWRQWWKEDWENR